MDAPERTQLAARVCSFKPHMPGRTWNIESSLPRDIARELGLLPSAVTSPPASSGAPATEGPTSADI